MKKKIKIIVVDDHTIVRHGMCEALDAENDFTVIAQADSGRSAIDLALELCPDIVLMDISMPDLNGMETTRKILADNSNIKIIALTMHSEKVYVRGMLDAGVSGYILKSCSFKELLHCIQTVLSGERCLCQGVAGHDEDFFTNKKTSILSNKEREVLQLIAEGNRSKGIAQKLNISVRTVDVHRVNIKNKLNIHSVAQLTKFALTEGITSLNM